MQIQIMVKTVHEAESALTARFGQPRASSGSLHVLAVSYLLAK